MKEEGKEGKKEDREKRRGCWKEEEKEGRKEGRKKGRNCQNKWRGRVNV